MQAGLIVGIPDIGAGNCFPFGCTVTGPGTIYQQVYAPGDFSGPIDITSLSFFRTQHGSPSDVLTSATYTVKLSYSANAVDALDTTTLSNNVGAGQVTFGTYALNGVTAGSGLTLVQNNSDFVYNPRSWSRSISAISHSVDLLPFLMRCRTRVDFSAGLTTSARVITISAW